MAYQIIEGNIYSFPVSFNPNKTHDPKYWGTCIQEICKRRGYDCFVDVKTGVIAWEEKGVLALRPNSVREEEAEKMYDDLLVKNKSMYQVHKETGRCYQAIRKAIRSVHKRKKTL